MAEKRKILEPVGTPSFSKNEALRIIRQLKKERLERRAKVRKK